MNDNQEEMKESVEVTEAHKSSKRNKLILLGVVVLCVVGFYGYIKYNEYYPSTEDAYVSAHVVHVAAQVSGKVDQVLVKNNQYVKKGQLLFTIEPEQYQYDLAKAEADEALYTQKLKTTIDAIASAKAQLKEAEAKQFVAAQKEKRFKVLVEKGAASKEEGDEIEGNLRVANAEVNTAGLSIAQQQSTYQVDKAQLASAKSQVQLAKLNLSYTKIYASTDGYITKFTLRPGSMVNIGDNLFVLVDSQTWWVDANYKETNLERIKVGQPVSIKLSMYPNHTFEGKVQSLSYGSGSVFSLLPPENASGNWVKVTERFPVKIMFTQRDNEKYPLRVGASATVTIDTLK